MSAMILQPNDYVKMVSIQTENNRPIRISDDGISNPDAQLGFVISDLYLFDGKFVYSLVNHYSVNTANVYIGEAEEITDNSGLLTQCIARINQSLA